VTKRTRKQYVDLVRELTVTDFKLKYEGSVLGYLWSFAKPLMLFGILYFVFTIVFRLGGSIPHYAVYLLLGVVLWIFFADATVTAMTSIVDRQELIRKVAFPRLVLVIAASATSLITLAINLAIIAVFIAVLGARPSPAAPLILLLLVELYALALGCSLFLAALYVRFRDFRHIWEVVLQILFYASPIIYPISIIPAHLQSWALVNPLAQIFQDSRSLLVTASTLTTADTLSAPALVVPYLIPFVLLAGGFLYFRAASGKFAEVV